jgi:hypothetical protein
MTSTTPAIPEKIAPVTKVGGEDGAVPAGDLGHREIPPDDRVDRYATGMMRIAKMVEATWYRRHSAWEPRKPRASTA